MNRNFASLLFAFLAFGYLGAQELNNVALPEMLKPQVRKVISMPDIPGYKTLKCDFHLHTVFSDGLVWPTVRVGEAWEEGLDAIAITDHIEYHPHRDYVKVDHNASFKIAKPLADAYDIILIRAGEITRSMPPGHLNGLFLKDVNALDTLKVEDALHAVVDQGGFIFWNHPGWKSQQPDTCMWMDMHTQLFEDGLIHGIEVFNHAEYYPVAINWALEKDLAILGNSDAHAAIAHTYTLKFGHRPMTLVFATNRSEEAIREALFAKRTVAWFDDKMIGREELLEQLFHASLEITDTGKGSTNKRVLKIKNNADIPFNISDNHNFQFTIPALGETYMTLPDEVAGIFVTNLLIGTGSCLEVDL